MKADLENYERFVLQSNEKKFQDFLKILLGQHKKISALNCNSRDIFKTCQEIRILCQKPVHYIDLLDKLQKTGIRQTSLIKIINLLRKKNALTTYDKYEIYYTSVKNDRDLPEFVRPFSAYWLLTRKCNLACSMCYFHTQTYRNVAPVNNNYNELSYDEISRVMHDLKDNGVRQLIIAGGEPFLRQDLFKILELSVHLGIEVELITNGTIIDDSIADLMMKNNFWISFSLEGSTRELNDSIRGAGVYDKVLANLAIYKKYRSFYKRGNIILCCTIQNDNVDDINSFLNFGQNQKVDLTEFNLLTFNPEKGLDERFYNKLFKQVKSNLDQKNSASFKWGRFLIDGTINKEDIISTKISKNFFMTSGVPCYMPARLVSIDALGNVRPCCVCLNKTFGNVREQNFFDIWHGREFNLFRKKMLNPVKDESYTNLCNYCDLFADSAQLHENVKKIQNNEQ